MSVIPHAPAAASAEPSALAQRLYRAIWRWHFFAGLLAVPFMIGLAMTGGLYLFNDEIDASLFRYRNYVAVGERVLPPSALVEKAVASVPGSALASELSRRLASAQSLIESSGGGRRIESDRRVAVASLSGPVRISGDDRRRGELVERLADRLPDLVADPGNRRLLVAERGQAIGQHQQSGSQPRQHSGPGSLDRFGRQQLAAASARLHLGDVGLGLDETCPFGAARRNTRSSRTCRRSCPAP